MARFKKKKKSNFEKKKATYVYVMEFVNGNQTNREKKMPGRNQNGASLVAQWLRIHLPMQETWVRALVREDPTCCGATKPVRHNY